MKITNYLDILPLELHGYINDIIESDRKYHDWEKAKKHLEDFIHSLESFDLNVRKHFDDD